MGYFETSLKAVEQARRRKKGLKSLIQVLYEEYNLVKTEIKLHQEHIEKQMSSNEYSAFLDTIKMALRWSFHFLPIRKGLITRNELMEMERILASASSRSEFISSRCR